VVNAIIYLEGGEESKELHSRCREGFHKLLEKNGFKGKMPRLKACGSRNSAFNDFRIAHQSKTHPFIALWIDSEDPVPISKKHGSILKNVMVGKNLRRVPMNKCYL